MIENKARHIRTLRFCGLVMQKFILTLKASGALLK